MLKDLEELVNAGIISRDTAEQITHYYQSKENNTGSRFNALLGILGALLVSAGIVLVVAHNWDNLNKIIKTVLAFLPMIIGQALCAYTLWRKRDSRLWCECSSVVLFFAMAAGISLVSQIYQVSGSLEGFILTWLLATAPLVYIMNSSVTSLLVIAAATWYGYLAGYSYGDQPGLTTIPWYYLAFLLFVAPHYYWYARHKRQSPFFHFHSWFLALSIIINIGMVNSIYLVNWGTAVYLALFCLYYAIGNTPFFKRLQLAANPFLITGLMGTVIILLFWTFQFGRDYLPSSWKNTHDTLLPFHYTLIILLLLTAALLISNFRKDKRSLFDPVGFSTFLVSFCLLIENNFLSTFSANIWVLIIGLFYIRKGSLRDHFGVLNLGLLIILILAILRFFDDDIPFVWRGFFFVLAGTGFFVANYLMMRKRKAVTQNNNI